VIDRLRAHRHLDHQQGLVGPRGGAPVVPPIPTGDGNIRFRHGVLADDQRLLLADPDVLAECRPHEVGDRRDGLGVERALRTHDAQPPEQELDRLVLMDHVELDETMYSSTVNRRVGTGSSNPKLMGASGSRLTTPQLTR